MIGLMSFSAAASTAAAKTLPLAIAVHVAQSPTLRSMEGVQSELGDIRAKLQRDRDRLRLRISRGAGGAEAGKDSATARQAQAPFRNAAP
jgi:hypothetical protein